MTFDKDSLYPVRPRINGGHFGTSRYAGQNYTGVYHDPEPYKVGDRFTDVDYDIETDDLSELRWYEVTSVGENGRFSAKMIGPVICACGGVIDVNGLCRKCGKAREDV